MNQTQKKYVIQQAFAIIQAKITKVRAEDSKAQKEANAFLIDPAALKKAIEKGTVKLRSKPTSTNLDGLFYTTSYFNARKKAANKKYGTTTVTRKTIHIPNPYVKELYMREGLRMHSTVYPSTVKRIEELAAKMDAFIEEVIIGDSETARAMLKELQGA